MTSQAVGLFGALPNTAGVLPGAAGIVKNFPPDTRYLIVFGYGNFSASQTFFRLQDLNAVWRSPTFALDNANTGTNKFFYEVIPFTPEHFAALNVWTSNTDNQRSCGTFEIVAVDSVASWLGTVNQPVKVDPSNPNGFPVQNLNYVREVDSTPTVLTVAQGATQNIAATAIDFMVLGAGGNAQTCILKTSGGTQFGIYFVPANLSLVIPVKSPINAGGWTLQNNSGVSGTIFGSVHSP